jgi:hypothetical protein
MVLLPLTVRISLADAGLDCLLPLLVLADCVEHAPTHREARRAAGAIVPPLTGPQGPTPFPDREDGAEYPAKNTPLT